MKIHNFSAGPSILPKEVMHDASKAVKELGQSGLSLIEISHRSKDFISIMDEACRRALELTNLENKGYKALFLQGGASQQFIMSAYNLLENKAGFINTGTWSSKAIKEAKLIGEVLEIASSKDSNFNYIPKEYNTPADLDYLHITTNNTIFGTQFKKIPETDVSLVADMSSDIFSRDFDYSKFNKIPWKFGIINGKLYENGLPHTRGDVIILSKRIIRGNYKWLIELLIHEKTHVFQKLYPDYASNYIKQNNFVKVGHNKGIVRANPDTDDYTYADMSGNELKAIYKENAKRIKDVIIQDQYYEHPFERMAIDFEKMVY